MNNICIYITIAITLFFTSCSSSTVEPSDVDYGYEYFPVNDSMEFVYSVKEIVIDAPSERYDTLIYDLKCLYVNKEEIDIETERWEVERYKKINGEEKWMFSEKWQIEKNKNRLLAIEENIMYYKLYFPLSAEAEWNGNGYNQEDELYYSVASIDKTENIGSVSYDSVAHIIHEDTESLIEKKYADEKYAKNIGLISRKVIDVKSFITGDNEIEINKPLMERITVGTLFEMSLISYDLNKN